VKVYQGLSLVFTPFYQSNSRLLAGLRDYLLAPLSRRWPLRSLVTRMVSGDMTAPVRTGKTSPQNLGRGAVAEPGE